MDHHPAAHWLPQNLLINTADALGGAALLERDGALAEFGVDDAVIADCDETGRQFDIAVLRQTKSAAAARGRPS